MEWYMCQAMRLQEVLHAILLTNRPNWFNHHPHRIGLRGLTRQKHAKVALNMRLKPSRFSSYSKWNPARNHGDALRISWPKTMATYLYLFLAVPSMHAK